MTIEIQIPAYHLCTIGKAAREAVQAGYLKLLAADGSTKELKPIRARRARGYVFEAAPEPRIYRITKSGKILGFYKLEA